ncbi:MAG: hypothetical protein PGN11_07855 [Quadrisphaera sp.]
MDVVEFHDVEAELGVGRSTTVLPHVNGKPLPLLLELAAGGRRERSRRAVPFGGSHGLVEDEVRWPSRHYLGEPVLGSFDDDTALLGCGCGIYSCRPFSAVVEVDDDVVVWSRFRFADPDVLLTDLRDLVFDRAQYEAAVRTTEIGGGGRVYRSRVHRSVR